MSLKAFNLKNIKYAQSAKASTNQNLTKCLLHLSVQCDLALRQVDWWCVDPVLNQQPSVTLLCRKRAERIPDNHPKLYLISAD